MTLKPETKKLLLKSFKGLIYSMGAAGVTYLLGILNLIDVDIYTPLVVATTAAVLNALKETLKQKTENLEKE